MSREKDQRVGPFEQKPKTVTTNNSVPVTFGSLNPPPRDVEAMTTRQLIEELEDMGFCCVGGPLGNSAFWRELRERLGHPSPPNESEENSA